MILNEYFDYLHTVIFVMNTVDPLEAAGPDHVTIRVEDLAGHAYHVIKILSSSMELPRCCVSRQNFP